MKKFSYLLAFFCLFLALNKTYAFDNSYFLGDKKCVEYSSNIPLGGKVYYSSDNKQYSYLTIKNNKQVLVLNGEELNYFSNYTIYGFVNYGKDLIFSTNYNGKEVLFIGKKQIGVYDTLDKSSFIQSSLNDSYMLSGFKNSHKILIKDDLTIYTNLIDNNFGYSPDGKKYYYYYKTDSGFNLFFNGVIYKNYKIYFSKKTSNYVFVKYYNNKQSVVFYGKEADLYDEISDFIFSPDGRQYAFIGKKNQKIYLVKNGFKLFEISKNGGFSFSDNSQKLVSYGVINSKIFYAIEDKLYFPDVKSINSLNWTIDNNFLLNVSDYKFDNFFMINGVKNYNFTNIEKFSLSKNNDKIAFLGRDFKNTKVLNISGEKIYGVNFLDEVKFSSDASEFLYSYKNTNNNSFIAINNKVSKPYFNISNLSSSDSFGVVSFYGDSKFVLCSDLSVIYKMSYKQREQLNKIVKFLNTLTQKDKSFYKIQTLKKMSNYPKDTLQYDILKMIYQNVQ